MCALSSHNAENTESCLLLLVIRSLSDLQIVDNSVKSRDDMLVNFLTRRVM